MPMGRTQTYSPQSNSTAKQDRILSFSFSRTYSARKDNLCLARMCLTLLTYLIVTVFPEQIILRHVRQNCSIDRIQKKRHADLLQDFTVWEKFNKEWRFSMVINLHARGEFMNWCEGSKGRDKCCCLCVFCVTIRRTILDEMAFEMTTHENTGQERLNTQSKTFNFDIVSERVERCTKYSSEGGRLRNTI